MSCTVSCAAEKHLLKQTNASNDDDDVDDDGDECVRLSVTL